MILFENEQWQVTEAQLVCKDLSLRIASVPARQLCETIEFRNQMFFKSWLDLSSIRGVDVDKLNDGAQSAIGLFSQGQYTESDPIISNTCAAALALNKCSEFLSREPASLRQRMSWVCRMLNEGEARTNRQLVGAWAHVEDEADIARLYFQSQNNN